jgi:hypothetical protein
MQVTKNDSETFQCIPECGSDEIYYQQLKSAGKFKDGEWVVIRNMKLLVNTPDERVALETVDKQMA